MITITSELKSHFLRLYHMAITDDDFSPLELKMLYDFAEERGVPKEELEHILLTTTEKFTIPSEVEKRIEYLYDLALMIYADEIVTDEELSTLKKYCRQFEFLDENIDELCEFLLNSAKDNLPKFQVINSIFKGS